MSIAFYILVALLFVYEYVALVRAAHGRTGETISEIIWRWSKRPLIPFAFGLLAGHLFWQG